MGRMGTATIGAGHTGASRWGTGREGEPFARPGYAARLWGETIMTEMTRPLGAGRRSLGWGLIVFLAVTVGGGLLIGALTVPGSWYAGLAKPSFNPPGWVFGPVWTVLYVMIGVAGWRLWRQDQASPALLAWAVQLALNFAWSPTFFGAHAVGAALGVIVALLLAIVATLALAWPRDRWAALLLLPYLAWVAFATALNGAIWMLN